MTSRRFKRFTNAKKYRLKSLFLSKISTEIIKGLYKPKGGQKSPAFYRNYLLFLNVFINIIGSYKLNLNGYNGFYALAFNKL